MSLTAYVPSEDRQITHDQYESIELDERMRLKPLLRHPIARDVPVLPRRGHNGELGKRIGHFYLPPDAPERLLWPAEVEFDSEYGEEIDGVRYVKRTGESPQHAAGKERIAQEVLRELGPKPEGYCTITFEKILFDVEADVRRIADVYVSLPDGDEVYEIQLSPIPIEEVHQRTKDYEKLGLVCWWIFGGSCAKRSDIQHYLCSPNCSASEIIFRVE